MGKAVLALGVIFLAAFAAVRFSVKPLLDMGAYYSAPVNMIGVVRGIEHQLRMSDGRKVDYALEDALLGGLATYCNYERSGRASGLGHRFLRAFVVPEMSVIEEVNKNLIIDIADYRKRYPIGDDYFTRDYGGRRDAGEEAAQGSGAVDAEILEIIKGCWQILEQDAERYRKERST